MNFRVKQKIKDERKKQQEFKNSTGRQIDQVYALAVGPEECPIYFYVGIAVNPNRRWDQHRRAIEHGRDMKPAYEFARYHKFRHTLRMVVLDPEGNETETWWKNFLLSEGHPLQNVGGTVDIRRKKRVKSPVQLAFEQVNKPRPGELDELVRAAKVKGWI